MELFAWLILPLLLLVAIPHELGHLLAARALGIGVLEFGIGLPPRAVSVRRGGIAWTIGWLLPFGAFVRLKGENGGSAADDFAARPAWQQNLVVVAGPLANVLVAGVAVALSLLVVGRPTGLATVVRSVEAGSSAAEAGLRAGDVVINVNGMRPTVALAGSREPLDVQARRGDLRLERRIESADGLTLGRTMEYAAIGASAPVESEQGVVVQPTPVLGWVGIAQLMQELADVNIPPLAWFLALLAAMSLGLGLANLLPVPPLDGSRVLLSAVVAARGQRPIGARLNRRLNMAGLAVLVLLFVVVTGADLARLLSGRSLMG